MAVFTEQPCGETTAPQPIGCSPIHALCVAPDITELTREPSNLVGKPRSYNQLVSSGVHDHFELDGARTPVLLDARWDTRLSSSVAIARAYERTGRLPSNTSQAPFGLNLTCGLGAQLIRVRRPTLVRRRPQCTCGLGTIGHRVVVVVVAVVVVVVRYCSCTHASRRWLATGFGETLEAHN